MSQQGPNAVSRHIAPLRDRGPRLQQPPLSKSNFETELQEFSSTYHSRKLRRNAGGFAGAATLALQPQQPRYLGESADTAETPAIRLELPIPATTAAAALAPRFRHRADVSTRLLDAPALQRSPLVPQPLSRPHRISSRSHRFASLALMLPRSRTPATQRYRQQFWRPGPPLAPSSRPLARATALRSLASNSSPNSRLALPSAPAPGGPLPPSSSPCVGP